MSKKQILSAGQELQRVQLANWLGVPKAMVTPCSLILPRDLPFETWAAMGPKLGQIHRMSAWIIGDWLAGGEIRYGETYAQFADSTGLLPEYLMILKYVASRIDADRRKPGLSFGHHKVVAPLEPDEQDRLLAEAESHAWTRDQLAEAVRLFKAQIESPADDDGHGLADGPDDDSEGDSNVVIVIEREPVVDTNTGTQQADLVGEDYAAEADAADDIARYSVEDWQKLPSKKRRQIIEEGFASGYSHLNKQTNESIDWAKFSENAVTGCLHGCPFCYARDIAQRFFSYGFAPYFHPHRLAAPGNVKVPDAAFSDPSFKNIFIDSMGDLFGQWVPVEWIEAEIAMARRNPQWNFLSLTKFPQRAAEFEFPDNFWIGTTVDAQARLHHAEQAFSKIRCRTKWLSCEPLLTPLKFTRLDLFQWIVIGGASRSTQTPEWRPPFAWIVDLYQQARAAGLKIYMKTNLGIADDIRVKEFAWAEQEQKRLPDALKYLKGMK